MKQLIFIYLFCVIIFGQVAPFEIPYDISSDYNILLDSDNSFNFKDSDKLEISGTDNYIWQKKIEIRKESRIILKIENNTNCDGTLFLKNAKEEISGPYQISRIKKTNPFKGKIIEIQFISNNDCDIEQMEFMFDYYENNIKESNIYNSYHQDREEPIILITGYWPPTNEMIRDFSQNLNLNGWIGDDWEGRGYDIISYFPEFEVPDCDDCGQGYGDLEVDYQDTSDDFWPIVNDIKPIAIITFSRGYIDYSWELEYNYYNRLNWIGDFYPPYLPTPNPPDDSVENYFIRHSSLPMNDIMEDISFENIGLDSYIDWDGDPGHYVSEFMGYHGVWYHDINQLGNNKCIAAGHVHVGGLIDIETAKIATYTTLRSVINYLDQFNYILGDINQDDIIDILDLVLTLNYILGIQEFENIQMYAADMNEDGIINIQDIINIINIILEN